MQFHSQELIEINFSLIFGHQKGLNFHYKKGSWVVAKIIRSLILSTTIPSIHPLLYRIFM